MSERLSKAGKRKEAGKGLTLARALGAMALCAGLPVAVPVAKGQQTAAAHSAGVGVGDRDGPRVGVTAFRVRYARPDAAEAGLPGVDELGAVRVALSVVDGVYVAPREAGDGRVEVLLAELMDEGRPGAAWAASGVNQVGAAIIRELNSMGIIGVFVGPDPAELDPRTGRDLRSGTGEARPLTLVISTSAVTRVSTVAAGERTQKGEEASSRVHRRIAASSPIAVRGADGVQPAGTTNVLRRDVIEDYLSFVNRHPARQVSATAGKGEKPGESALEYTVFEAKPWTIYGQLSNTGSEQTDDWRERFGFAHYQLTNSDDILAIDFETAGFESSQSLSASYERPLDESGRWRWRIFGSASEYTASDIGLDDDSLGGESWSLGGEVIGNLLQRRKLFVDAVAGVRLDQIDADNSFTGDSGSEAFLQPYVGVRLERLTRDAATFGSLTIETVVPGATAAGDDDAVALGRTEGDSSWTLVRGSLAHSFYLEPLLLGGAWDDPATPDSKATLAHEIALSVRGQWTPGNARLIPQAQDTVGGFYSVRGYPEAAVAGDSAVVMSAEYRFHVPRIFAVEPDPSSTPLFGAPFRWSRDSRYSSPDWDLIARGFVDAGRVWSNDALSFEDEETLLSAGVGLELQVKRNLNLRLDWGVALEEIGDGEVTEGDSRLHFSATFVF